MQGALTNFVEDLVDILGGLGRRLDEEEAVLVSIRLPLLQNQSAEVSTPAENALLGFRGFKTPKNPKTLKARALAQHSSSCARVPLNLFR